MKLRKSRAWGAATIALALTVLVGCGTYESQATQNSLYEQTITLHDGRAVTCIVFAEYSKGGLSCDWVGAGR